MPALKFCPVGATGSACPSPPVLAQKSSGFPQGDPWQPKGNPAQIPCYDGELLRQLRHLSSRAPLGASTKALHAIAHGSFDAPVAGVQLLRYVITMQTPLGTFAQGTVAHAACQQDLSREDAAKRRDLLPLSLPLMCDATCALRHRLNGRGDRLLAGTGAWLFLVVI
eukprot:5652084-Heterocapsa_arctica.AAC.1